MRYLGFSILFLMICNLPVLAQQNDMSVESEGVPEGWEIRLDTPGRADLNNLVFTISGGEHHINSGRSEAAIFYRPTVTASGTYRVSGRFDQLEEAGHPTSYGLFVGGQNLQDDDQHYLYFLVRQTGEYLIKRRNGSDTETIVDWTTSDAVNAWDGEMTNDLELIRGEDNVTFAVNGEVLETIPVSELNYLDGIAGLRVTHLVNVSISNFEVNSMN